MSEEQKVAEASCVGCEGEKSGVSRSQNSSCFERKDTGLIEPSS